MNGGNYYSCSHGSVGDILLEMKVYSTYRVQGGGVVYAPIMTYKVSVAAAAKAGGKKVYR